MEGVKSSFLLLRELRLGVKPRILPGAGIFAGAILAVAFDWLPVQIALVIAAVLMAVTGLVTLRGCTTASNGR